MRKWNRADGWTDALAQVVEKHLKLPFEYGKSDCGQFAADAVEAVTGHDLFKDYRNYTTKTGAARVLRKAECNNLGELFSKYLNETHIAHAMRGDIGVIEYDGQICAGVFTGVGFACKGENGLVFVNRDQVKQVFEV